MNLKNQIFGNDEVPLGKYKILANGTEYLLFYMDIGKVEIINIFKINESYFVEICKQKWWNNTDKGNNLKEIVENLNIKMLPLKNFKLIL